MIRATLPVIITLFTLATSLFAQQGVAIPESHPGPYHPLFDEYPQGSPLTNVRPDLLDTIKPTFAKDTLMIDFESRQVTFSRFDTLSGYPLWEFHYAELGDYLKNMEKHTSYNLSKKILIEKGKKKKSATDAPLTLALPAHLPAWATRILGKEPPQLSITGSQKIKLGFKSTKNGTNGVYDTTLSNKEIVFQPTSNFVIRGSVGRLLKLEIRMAGNSSKEVFESADKQLENIKIEYKEEVPGELEDDIIQEVVVGKTSFNMPGQGLAGYSTGSNEGLFGVKIRSQVGPLSLTTIASIEQTEKQTKSIDLNANNTPIKVGESRMQDNLYFFLDEVYRLKYLAEFADSSYLKSYMKKKAWTTIPKLKTVDVYKRITGTTKPNTTGKTYEWASYKMYTKQGSSGKIDSTVSTSIFEKLIPDQDYRVNSNTGWISFDQPLSDNDVVAIYMEDSLKTNVRGNKEMIYDGSLGVNKLSNLWVIKNDRNVQVPGDSTYDLAMRNVYSLSSSSGKPDFTIKRLVGANDEREKNDNGVYYAKILGLMDANDNFLYSNNKIFDMDNNCVLFPPHKKSATDTQYDSRTALYPFLNPELGETNGEKNYGSVIYEDRSSQVWTDRFSMVTTKKEKSTSFNLDFGVMEESETIKTGDGVTLVRNEDYTIDYGMGMVELISTNARSASRIEAEYQKASLFFLEKKVFLGVNGKVNLPGIGRNSYVGTTFMWQLMDTKSMMPKVGTEPFNRFLFDANIELDFEPAWMTALVNMIPLVSSDVASSARFSLEIAKSKTASSAKSNGEAYIDNFSTSARTYSLGTEHGSWYPASPESGQDWLLNPPVWHQFWIQPAPEDNRSEDREIFPPKYDANGVKKDVSFISTLRLVVQPYPEDLTLRKAVSKVEDGKLVSTVSPWAGIMRGFTGSLSDRRNDRYFEFWMRSPAWKSGVARSGQLLVDLGQVPEDLVIDGSAPNSSSDYEVINEALTPDNDLGLDRAADTAEYWKYPNLSGIEPTAEVMKYGDDRLGMWKDDPARDNWKNYVKGEPGNAPYANGTQNNIRVRSVPDNEDVNGNGTVYLGRGSYFRYTIDLANIQSSPYVSTTERAYDPTQGWVKIKIPVGDNALSEMYDSIGEPSWKFIDQVRFIWKDFDSTIINNAGFRDTLEFHALQFIGNQWREQVKDSINVGVVTATVEDSRNTAGYRRPPAKGIETTGGTDQVTDYTLVLDFDGVQRDSTALVYRDFSGAQSMDLTNYGDMRFWVEDLNKEITTSRNSWFVFRFGSNDSTYYEFKTRRLIDASGSGFDNLGWNSDSGLVVTMKKFADLKDQWYKVHGERMKDVDTSYADQNGDTLRIVAKTEQMPTVSAIRWIGFGVANHNGTDYISRVRVNGLRATGMADREGWAVRSAVDLGFADFLKSNVNMKYTDADFRSMSQDVYAKGSTSLSGGASSEIQLAKFLPDRAAVKLPLGASMNSTLTRPEMRPNSDISLRDNGKADGFGDMTDDFSGLILGDRDKTAQTASAEYQQTQKDYRVYTSYRKPQVSQHSAINLTLERIGTEYSYAVADNSTRYGIIPKDEIALVRKTSDTKYHVATSETKSHTFGLDYDLSPTKKFRDSTSWEPFRDSKNKKMNRKLKGMRFNPVPTKVTFDLIKMNYSRDTTYNSMFVVRDSNYSFRPTERLGITHKAEINYEPISPFTSATLTVNSKRDFDSFLKKWKYSGVDNFIEHGLVQLDSTWRHYGVLNMESNRDHATQFRFTPDLLNWLTPEARISSNYTQGVDVASDSVYMKGNLGSKFNVDTKLRIRRLFEDIGNLGKKDNGFKKGMKAIASGMDKVDFENFDFDYSADMAVSASYLDRKYVDKLLDTSAASYYAWTLGFHDRSFLDIAQGKMNDQKSFGGVQNRNGWYGANESQKNSSDTRKTTQSTGARTNFKLPEPIDFSFDNLSVRWTRDYSIFQKFGKMDTTITWPEVKVSGTTAVLKKVPAIAENFSNMNFKTGYVYSKKVNRHSDYFVGENDSSTDVTQNITFRYGLDPLVKLDGVMKKWKIDMGYSMSLMYDTTIGSVERFADDAEGKGWREFLQNGRKDITTNHVWSAGYKVPGKSGRTLKLFRERVIELKGDQRFTFNVDFTKKRNNKYDHTQKNDMGEYPKLETWEDREFNLSPKYEYDVTKNIGFLLYYNMNRSTKNPDKSERRNNEVAGELTISF